MRSGGKEAAPTAEGAPGITLVGIWVREGEEAEAGEGDVPALTAGGSGCGGSTPLHFDAVDSTGGALMPGTMAGGALKLAGSAAPQIS